MICRILLHSACAGWTVAMAMAMAVRLTVRFDGSLRAAPSTSSTTISRTTPMVFSSTNASASSSKPSFAWPSTSASEPTARLASCAASLHWDDDDDRDGSHQPILLALVGQLLDPSEVTLSGQAEYEGLILGLHLLNDFIASDLVARDAALPRRLQTLSIDSIHIQGDCKTVVDQIRGRSRPRRLEAYWSRAQPLLASIEGQLKCADMSPRIKAEHIPRGNNTVCDELASRIVLRQHRINARELWSAIVSYPHHRYASSAPSIMELLLNVPLLVPASARPAFYIQLAQVAWTADAFLELVLVGQQLEKELKSAIVSHRRSHGSDKAGEFSMWIGELHASSVALQIVGWTLSNDAKEASRVRRRHRHALEAHPEVLRAMERATAENGSLSDLLQRWVDVLPPLLEEVEPAITTRGSAGAIDEWVCRAYTSKEWDEGRSFVLWSPQANF